MVPRFRIDIPLGREQHSSYCNFPFYGTAIKLINHIYVEFTLD